MGLDVVGAGLSLVSGVAGASRQSESLRASAAQERQIANYNSHLAIYNAEGRANKVQFDTESQAVALERNRVLANINSDAQIRAQDNANENQLSKDTAQLFGTVGDAANPMGEVALAQQRQSNILQKQAQIKAARYQDAMNLYSQRNVREQGTTQAFNERQQGVFQSAAISAPAYASAAQKEKEADGVMSSALFSGIGQIATGPIGGLLGVHSIFGGGGAPATSGIAPLFTPGVGTYTNGINGPFNNPFGG